MIQALAAGNMHARRSVGGSERPSAFGAFRSSWPSAGGDPVPNPILARCCRMSTSTTPDFASVTPILPAHIEETVHAIGRLHIDHRQGSTGLQRVVERLTRFLSRPAAAGLLALGVAIWIGLNLILEALGAQAFDPPPFDGLQSLTGVGALLMTVFILVTQRREDELSELREQLTLQLAMVSEQKTAKLIELIEELRRDLPNVHDRPDAEAASLSHPSDRDAVLEALRENQVDARSGEGAKPADPEGGS
jgi:uncharacterized membrane protein